MHGEGGGGLSLRLRVYIHTSTLCAYANTKGNNGA